MASPPRTIPAGVAASTRPQSPARLGDVARTAAVDFYYQSIRIVPANVSWGVAVVALIGVAAFVSPVLALALCPLLSIPFVGVLRLAALVARGEDVVLSDLLVSWRRFAVPAVLFGALVVAVVAVLVGNVVGGAVAGGPAGWAFATLAGWGLVLTWVIGLAFWSVLVDPAREQLSIAGKVRLAVATVLAFPARFGGLALFIAVVLTASAIAVVALLTIGLAYAALVTTRYTLSATDSVERWVEERGRAV